MLFALAAPTTTPRAKRSRSFWDAELDAEIPRAEIQSAPDDTARAILEQKHRAIEGVVADVNAKRRFNLLRDGPSPAVRVLWMDQRYEADWKPAWVTRWIG